VTTAASSLSSALVATSVAPEGSEPTQRILGPWQAEAAPTDPATEVLATNPPSSATMTSRAPVVRSYHVVRGDVQL